MEHFKGNTEAPGLQLSVEAVEKIEQAYSFDVGFPHDMLTGGPNAAKGPEDHAFLIRLGELDFVKAPQPIPPHEL